jgi:hypothetical protein
MKGYIFRDETMKGAKDQEWFERVGKATDGQSKFISGGTANDSLPNASAADIEPSSLKHLKQSVPY